jgi:nitrogen fixation-related uncharacterized protein
MQQIYAVLLCTVLVAAAVVFWLRKRSQTDDDDNIEVHRMTVLLNTMVLNKPS